MATTITMPALSPTMEEGKLSRWLKAEGDRIKTGDVIAEIETDKATMEVESIEDGVLSKILVPAGTDAVKINTPIAILAGDGPDVKAPAPKPAASPAPAAKPVAVAAPAAAPAPAVSAAPQPAPGKRIFASPLARRLAAAKGIDLATLVGSGPHGRIVRADIDAARPAAPSAPAAPAPIGKSAGPDAKALADALGQAYTAVPNNNIRRTIARRLLEAHQTVPVFYLTVDVRLDALLKLRAEVNAVLADKVSVNDFVIKAAAKALIEVPEVNAAWSDDAVLRFARADVSVAVATDAGLITPIVRGAEGKSVAAISAEVRDLSTRAKAGKLKPEEYQGGSFSVSNLGMFGIRQFTAIINPPQSCILAVGRGEERAVVRDGQIVPETLMTVTLTCDHRVVDGAVGARFLQAFTRLLEAPLSLLV